MRFSFCPKCGGRLFEKIVAGASRPVCVECGFVFYQNPPVQSVVVALREDSIALITWGEKQKYSLPAGFVEENEEPIQAAKRELYEETGLSCEKFSLMEVSNRVVLSEGMKLGAVSVYYQANNAVGELAPLEKHLTAVWLPLEKVKDDVLWYPDDRQMARRLKEALL